jgi:hypothetical protein
VVVTDTNSTNGTFDAAGERLAGPRILREGELVRLGSSSITLLAGAPAMGTQVMAQVPATTGHSLPGQPVRHSYPLASTTFGLAEAMRLLGQTAPFVLARLAVLVGKTVAAFACWLVVLAGFLFLWPRSSVAAWGWLVIMVGLAGCFWHAVVRYFLYLLKAAHIAVLTELITQGRIGNGSESMFAYGQRVVKERFGQVNVLFALDLLVDGVVSAFNRTLDWVGSLLPVPGLQGVMGVVQAVVRGGARQDPVVRAVAGALDPAERRTAADPQKNSDTPAEPPAPARPAHLRRTEPPRRDVVHSGSIRRTLAKLCLGLRASPVEKRGHVCERPRLAPRASLCPTLYPPADALVAGWPRAVSPAPACRPLDEPPSRLSRLCRAPVPSGAQRATALHAIGIAT